MARRDHQTGPTHRPFRRMCPCHHPAMGHRFYLDNLGCGRPECSVNWYQHQTDPRPCVGLTAKTGRR